MIQKILGRLLFVVAPQSCPNTTLNLEHARGCYAFLPCNFGLCLCLPSEINTNGTTGVAHRNLYLIQDGSIFGQWRRFMLHVASIA